MRLSAATGGALILLVETVFGEGGVNSGGNHSIPGEGWSYVGAAAYDLLGTEYAQHRPQQWDITSGKIVGDLHYTPLDFWNPTGDTNDPPEGHSDWFPTKMGEIVARTTEFCDLMSLSPPDGMFQEELRKALRLLADRAESRPRTNPIRVRMMFGHIISQPVNVTAVVESLTEGINPDANLQVWAGAWRDGLSWNHAKLIAVDGRYLHTGGHNMWDSDYLQETPVHDLSFELEGQVTAGAHYFANWQWDYLKRNENQESASILDILPDIWKQNEDLQNLIQEVSSQWTIPPLPLSLNSVAEFPTGVAAKYPPEYTGSSVSETRVFEGAVPMISMGKQGSILEDEPSEDAFVAMFDAAKSSIKCAQQDLGPRTLSPETPVSLPGFAWPENHLSAFGRALMRGVDVEIVLSNVGAREHGGYSNGWTCNEVAAQIIRTIPQQFPVNATDKGKLKEIVGDKLRIGFLRGKFGNQWSNGVEIALHSKHFIIDDICTYIGSENLYSYDLAEWGVLVDDEMKTRKMMAEIWEPMYEYSYTGQDCDLDVVLNNLDLVSNSSQTEIAIDLIAEYLNNTDTPQLLLDFLSGGPKPSAPSGNKLNPTSSPTESPTDESAAVPFSSVATAVSALLLFEVLWALN